MTQKLVAITGAASGIGRGLAEEAIRRGYFCALFDADSEGLAAIQSKLGSADCFSLTGDVRNPDHVDAFADAVKSSGFAIRYVFANAGVLRAGEVCSQPINEIEFMFEVNVFGTLRILKAMIPIMETQSCPSRLVITGSVSMFGAAPNYGAYSATKQSIWALAEALSAELAARESVVGVSMICPSAVKTAIADASSNGDATVAKLKRRMEERGIAPELLATHVFDELEIERELIYSSEGLGEMALSRLNAVLGGRFRP